LKEVKNLEGQLKDYNLLLEKFHTATDNVTPEQLIQQAQALKKKNDVERQKVDQIFTERN
jgi:hypothetical protein